MQRKRTARRRLLPALALGALALLMSGCVSVTGLTFSQSGVGPVVLGVNGCANKTGSACPTSLSTLVTTNDPGQMLVALLVPTDYPAPATFTLVGQAAPVFRPSPTYTSELQRLLPTSPGQKWAGYISDVSTFTPGSTGSLSFSFDRPAPADGSPRPAPADITVVVGARTASGLNGDVGTRPVFCGATPADLSGSADNTVCRDSQANVNRRARDLALSGGAPVAVAAGATAIVPVTARYAGDAAPEVNFTLSATTTVPGATAVPNALAYAPPSDSTNTVSVSVAVPPSTPPGTYGVTLTARLATGDVRTATAPIVVGTGTGGVTGASARCAGRAATIVGTAGPDTLKGTAGPDVIAGRGGADVITGLGGDDLICGDAGPDRISGGAGRDRILGGAGADRLNGGAGRDTLAGGLGADILAGGAGIDALQGGAGANKLTQ